MGENELFIFDWSGVISDDRMPVYEANMALLKHFGKQGMSFEEWLPRTRLTAEEFLADHGVSEDPQVLYGLFKQYLNEAIARGVKPFVYPDAAESLEYLKSRDKTLAVLSSHPAANLRKEAVEYGLEEFFELFQGDAKDKSAGLLDVCEQFQVDPSSSWYLGDTIYDITAAKGAGVKSIGVSTGYHIRERLATVNPDLLLENLTELKEKIK